MNEIKRERRADDKRTAGAVDWTDAPRFTAMGIAETWSVTVEAEGQRVLCISDQHVAGLDGERLEQFAPTIRSCAQHLLGFIGAAPIAGNTATVRATSVSAAEKPTGDLTPVTALTGEQLHKFYVEAHGGVDEGLVAVANAAIAAHLERQAQQAEDSKTQSEKVGTASAGGPPVSDAVRRLSERLKWMLDADQFSNIESMLRAIDLSEQPTLGSFPLICGACGEDRLKNPCSNPSDCSMIAMSFNVPTEIRSFALGGGFWARRESRTDGSIGWLLCDETDRIIRALDRHECSLIDATFVAAGNQRAAAPASQEGAHAAPPDDLRKFDRETTEADHSVLNLAATFSTARQFGREFNESGLLSFVDALGACAVPDEAMGHSPLPWKRQSKTGANRWRIVDADGRQVADINHYCEKAEANMALILAALKTQASAERSGDHE